MQQSISKRNIMSILARPFIKWVGGKSAIAQQIISHFPSQIDHYYELFTGGGGVFFKMAHKVQHAHLHDINIDLMVTYQVIQDNVKALIHQLKEHERQHNKDYFYKVRRQQQLQDSIERASRFIYLNKTCYNGLYRVNKKGEFNAPIGSYTNPTICDVNNLYACHKVLQDVDIFPYSFEGVQVKEGSVIYCDPPYDATYNQYTANTFNEDLQRNLHNKAIEWQKQGCKIFISNSNTDFIRKLYNSKYFITEEIIAPRSISCKGADRKNVTELLIQTK